MTMSPIRDGLLTWKDALKRKEAVKKKRDSTIKEEIITLKSRGKSIPEIFDRLKVKYKPEVIYKALRELGEI